MFIFLSCFSRFVRPCYYAPEKGKKVPRKNFLPLSPVQSSLVTPSFDKISELGKRKSLPPRITRMYAKHRHAWIYRSIRVLWRVWWAKPSHASDASRFGRICLAPPALVHLSPPQDGFAAVNLGQRRRGMLPGKTSAVVI